MSPSFSRMILLLAAAFAIGGAFILPAIAGEGCCAQCGCQCACQKICRLVYEEKKVEVVCWGCQCEDFCVPGPSEPGCKHCEEACTPTPGDAAKNICSKPHTFSWKDWTPSSAQIHTKKRLMKKVETRKVPGYKWVVQDLCPSCAANPSPVVPPAEKKLPPQPKSVKSAAASDDHPTSKEPQITAN